MSKRSIRLVAGIAGAAMALGTMAPAMADRLGGDDNSNGGGNHGLPVDLRCLGNLDLNPVDVSADLLFERPYLLNVGIGNDGHGGSTNVGLPHTILPPYVLDNDNLGDAVGCLLGGVRECIGDLDLNPVDVSADLLGERPSLLNIGLGNFDGHGGSTNIGLPHSILPPYIIDNHNIGDFLSTLAGCLGTLVRVGNPTECLGGLDLNPIDVSEDILGDERPYLVNVGIGNDLHGDGSTNVGLPDSILPPYVLDNDNLGDLVGCLLGHNGGDDELLSAVSGMTGLGGSPLAVLGGGASATSVVSLAGGLVGTTLNGSLTSILSAGGASVTSSLFASVAAVL